jgi:hypothetical protein
VAMRRTGNQDELRAAFDVQRRALIASCESYDSGHLWEALRLATSVHTLVHDGGKNNRSLLSQLGVRGSMRFLASGRDIAGSKNLLADTPLVIMRVTGSGVFYVPRLEGASPREARWLQVGKWWEEDLIFRSGGGHHRLTRKKLVFALRNQEGGSHFDAELKDPSYIEMAHGKTWSMELSDGTKRELRQLELATMRQVAWELLESVKRTGL